MRLIYNIKTARIGPYCWNILFANGLSQHKLNKESCIEDCGTIFACEKIRDQNCWMFGTMKMWEEPKAKTCWTEFRCFRSTEQQMSLRYIHVVHRTLHYNIRIHHLTSFWRIVQVIWGLHFGGQKFGMIICPVIYSSP